MISYEPFFRTLKEKNVSTYKLIRKYKVSSSLIDKLKHNRSVTTKTINDLCILLDCKADDIFEYVKDENEKPFYKEIEE